jgi:5-(carboxyamino)imidazole ribonucleotide synthase
MQRTLANSRRHHQITIGILGGGQLALMMARAASQLGIKVRVLDPSPVGPAKQSVTGGVDGEWSNQDTLRAFASEVDLVTLENEFVNASLLADLEERGHEVLPSSNTMRLVQDKFIQKQTLLQAGVPVVEFRSVATPEAMQAVGDEMGYPFVLKRRTLGYDGTGNFTVASPEDVTRAVERLGGYDVGLYAEKWCPFVMELAVMITRGRAGETVVYPVVESRQENHVCSSVLAPAAISAELAQQAQSMAMKAVQAVQGVGTFGIEFFLLPDGVLVVNEMAPRVHNSGHYTLEACDCSQFENHIRAVCGLPLGSAAMRKPAAMVNLLAKASAPGAPCGMGEALAVPGAQIHLYGKLKASPGRKMGHVTALGETAEEALATASLAASCITFED